MNTQVQCMSILPSLIIDFSEQQWEPLD